MKQRTALLAFLSAVPGSVQACETFGCKCTTGTDCLSGTCTLVTASTSQCAGEYFIFAEFGQTCGDAGHTTITDKAQCAVASSKLFLETDGVTPQDDSPFYEDEVTNPSGCYFDSSYANTDERLRFNGDMIDQGCTVGDYDCIPNAVGRSDSQIPICVITSGIVGGSGSDSTWLVFGTEVCSAPCAEGQVTGSADCTDPNAKCQGCSFCQTSFPTEIPTKYPTESPTKYPTDSPTKYPTDSPTKYPTESPTKYPTDSPTKYPTDSPTKYPTESPTKYPTESPTKYPTDSPTKYPTESPTDCPLPQCQTNFDADPDATCDPASSTDCERCPFCDTKFPTGFPTRWPTKFPTDSPTDSPTKYPTDSPTRVYCPSICQTSLTDGLLSIQGICNKKENAGGEACTEEPPACFKPCELCGFCNTQYPTDSPTKYPTDSPTKYPTDSPTKYPTDSPTKYPTAGPTQCESYCEDAWKTPGNTVCEKDLLCVQCEFCSFTKYPTDSPTKYPTESPTACDPGCKSLFDSKENPGEGKTFCETNAECTNCEFCLNLPTQYPTAFPTESPTKYPTDSPTKYPTDSPTKYPTDSPQPCGTGCRATLDKGVEENKWTLDDGLALICGPANDASYPNCQYCNFCTNLPTQAPTKNPTASPTKNPTASPTESPTKYPTDSPTKNPTASPTKYPTDSPTTDSPTDSPTKYPTDSPNNLVCSFEKAADNNNNEQLATLQQLEDECEQDCVSELDLEQTGGERDVCGLDNGARLDTTDGLQSCANGDSNPASCADAVNCYILYKCEAPKTCTEEYVPETTCGSINGAIKIPAGDASEDACKAECAAQNLGCCQWRPVTAANRPKKGCYGSPTDQQTAEKNPKEAPEDSWSSVVLCRQTIYQLGDKSSQGGQCPAGTAELTKSKQCKKAWKALSGVAKGFKRVKKAKRNSRPFGCWRTADGAFRWNKNKSPTNPDAGDWVNDAQPVCLDESLVGTPAPALEPCTCNVYNGPSPTEGAKGKKTGQRLCQKPANNNGIKICILTKNKGKSKKCGGQAEACAKPCSGPTC